MEIWFKMNKTHQKYFKRKRKQFITFLKPHIMYPIRWQRILRAVWFSYCWTSIIIFVHFVITEKEKNDKLHHLFFSLIFLQLKKKSLTLQDICGDVNKAVDKGLTNKWKSQQKKHYVPITKFIVNTTWFIFFCFFIPMFPRFCVTTGEMGRALTLCEWQSQKKKTLRPQWLSLSS